MKAEIDSINIKHGEFFVDVAWHSVKLKSIPVATLLDILNEHEYGSNFGEHLLNLFHYQFVGEPKSF